MTTSLGTDRLRPFRSAVDHDSLEDVVVALRAAREVPFESDRPAVWHRRFTGRVTEALVAMRGHASSTNTSAGCLRTDCASLVTRIDGLLASTLSTPRRRVGVLQMVELSERAVALELAARGHARTAMSSEEHGSGG